MAYYDRVRFEWDAAKDDANRRKHGLGFEEAADLFRSGTDHLEIFDEAHSEEEERFVCLSSGRSNHARFRRGGVDGA